MASKRVLHVAVVHIQYDDPKRANDESEYTVRLVNFSGSLEIEGPRSDVDLILEAVGDWVSEQELKPAIFVELVLREHFEQEDVFYVKSYEVVECSECRGSDGQ